MEQHVQFYHPINDVERGVIEGMVASLWRLRRTWAIQTQLHADAIDAQPPGDEVRRLAATPQLAILHRHETRLHNMRQRAIKNIQIFRTTPPSPKLPARDPRSPDSESVPETPAPAEPDLPDPPDDDEDDPFSSNRI